MSGLTAMQMRFVEEYLIDPTSQTKAAIRAGYSIDSAHSTASDLMKNPGVRDAIALAQDERAKKLGVDKLRILQELALIAFSNPKDIWLVDEETGEIRFDLSKLTRDTASAISEITQTETNVKGMKLKTTKVKQIEKLTALQLLGKHLGMFSDKVQVEGKLSLEQLVMDSYKKNDAPSGT